MTNEQHNKYIAYTFFGHAAFQLLMLLMMGVFFFFIFSIPGRPGDPGPPREFFGLFFGFMFFFQMLFVAPSLVAGYALLKKKSWARIASIVAGVLGAMNVPIGTAACVYSLWFFLGDNWKSVYPEKADQLRENKPELPYGVESQRAAYEAEQRGGKAFDPYEPPDWR